MTTADKLFLMFQFFTNIKIITLAITIIVLTICYYKREVIAWLINQKFFMCKTKSVKHG